MHNTFGNHEVLKGVNEHIEKGEKVVVIGPSGSGKSTFLRCLNRLETPSSGSIKFEGVEVDEAHIDPCARRWAWCSSILTCSPT